MSAYDRAVRAASAASEKKASDLVVLNVGELTLVTDYMVLCSGNNSIQVQAIAKHVRETLATIGEQPLGVEGFEQGQWILLDYGDVVVHVFHVEARSYYGLERLWGDAEWVDLEVVEA